MAAKYLMQGLSAGALVSWRADAPDWLGTLGPVGVTDVAVAGGGFDIDGSGSGSPDGAMTFDDGSFVVFDDGSFAVTS